MERSFGYDDAYRFGVGDCLQMKLVRHETSIFAVDEQMARQTISKIEGEREEEDRRNSPESSNEANYTRNTDTYR